ncbi:MAG TPA: formate dehydrogenase subunit alpha [Candidatus Merdenecus merdavium]|nr:formate dehydrogenase subunit alpha [Candidatus Merdenecus merdavium]
MVTCEINGKSCTTKPGTTILEASREMGIEIPTLCNMKELAPDGSCRMCVVEVEGGRKGGLVTSCTEHCKEGMKIHTHSERVVESRKFILDLLLSNHVFNCFKCGSNGNCKLQDYSLEYGLEKSSYIRGKKVKLGQNDTSNSLFEFNPELCIMCRRCARVCENLQGRDVISISGRGFDTQMSPAYGLPWSESNCESCGNCVSHCPTGALVSKDNRKNYRMYEVEKVRTTCPHCGTGCQMDLLVKNNRIVGVEPANGEANSNILCVKGKFGSYKFIHSPERLKHPLIKKNGVFEEASWEEALDLIESKFKTIKKEYGSDAIAGFSCSRAPNEDNYLFQKMMRAAFGTNNVDNCARVCHSASVHGLAMTLGSGAMTNPIKDITRDIDVILLVGSNTTEAHPVIGSQIRTAIRKGTKIIVVDPRKIDLAENADIFMQIRPGTNVAFANGMAHIIIKEGLADKNFIESRTEGYEEYAKLVESYTPERVAKICKIKEEDLRKAAIMYAKAPKAPIIYCLGVTEHSSGTEGVMSLSNLAMLVGKLGKSGCGINPLRGQNNVQGACDMGCMPYDFPGYQKVANEEVMKKFEKAWGVPLNHKTGLTSTQVLPAATAGTVKGLYIFGEDPMVTDPDIAHVRKALESLDFLVVQELFMTDTAELADVVLPGVSYAEKEGTFSNTERRVQRVRKAVELEGEMRLDTEIFADVMTRMGYPTAHMTSADIMKELASVTPNFAGISHARLDAGETLQWPCLDEHDKGKYIMHEGTFSRGLGLFYPAEYKESKELPDEEYPLLLVTGRMLYHYNTRSMTGKTEGINAISNESYIEINEEDAGMMGVKNGDKVKVRSRRGEIETTAVVGQKTNPQEVFMTFHFPDGNANHVTNAVFDDIANIPEYKVCAVRVSKSEK